MSFCHLLRNHSVVKGNDRAIIWCKKVKWSRYKPGVAQKVGRVIALPFHDHGTRRGVSDQQHTPAALYPRERPGTHFTGGWVGPRAGLERRKVSSPPGFLFLLLQSVTQLHEVTHARSRCIYYIFSSSYKSGI
jgi:hypothetical protein